MEKSKVNFNDMIIKRLALLAAEYVRARKLFFDTYLLDQRRRRSKLSEEGHKISTAFHILIGCSLWRMVLVSYPACLPASSTSTRRGRSCCCTVEIFTALISNLVLSCCFLHRAKTFLMECPVEKHIVLLQGDQNWTF